MTLAINNMMSSTQEPPPETTDIKPAKASSCVRCYERKVKCDRQKPTCSVCVRSNADCVFCVPPRRRTKRTQEDLLIARLKRYEDLLRSKGIEPQSINNADEGEKQGDDDGITTPSADARGAGETEPLDLRHSSPSFAPGRLISDQGRPRFIDK